MSTLLESMEQYRGEMTQWFEHMHRNPELSMQEEKTAKFIADTVSQWGYEVETGVGKHGIVASLKVGDSDKAIGLRADFDALPIQEDNDLAYKSETEGIAHLCGHDRSEERRVGKERRCRRARQRKRDTAALQVHRPHASTCAEQCSRGKWAD